MTQLQTQLFGNWSQGNTFQDSMSFPWVSILIGGSGPAYGSRTEYDHETGGGISTDQQSLVGTVVTFSDGDSFDYMTGIYTFADGQPNRFQTPTIGTYAPTPEKPDDNINSGVALFDKDGNPFVVADLRHIEVTGGLSIDKTTKGTYVIDGSGIQPNFNDTALTGNTTAENLSVSGDLTIDAIHFKQSIPTFPADQIPLDYQYPGRPFFVTFA